MSRFRLHCFSVLEFPDEKSMDPMDGGDPAVEHSGSAVRPPRNFISPLASTTASVADVLVGVGCGHSSCLLDRRAASVPRKAAGDADTSASAGEHSPNTSLHVPVGRNDCCSGSQSMELTECQGLSCQRVQRRHSVEMAGVLGHLRCASDFPVLRT